MTNFNKQRSNSANDNKISTIKLRSTTPFGKNQANIGQLKRQLRSTSIMASSSRRQLFLLGFAFVTLVVLLPPPSTERQNSVEAAKTLKALAKTFVFQRLTQSKHFVPLPVPIPVPIEIEEKPVYLKGKPKYVNVYKPKPTPQPVTKPTTVYHMPIYSPTYEYMSVDPMSSMYSSPIMYAGGGQHGASSYKSSLSTNGDSTSSSATASHSAVDYDDDAGSYYMRKAAARRNKLSAGDYAYDYNLHRNDHHNDHRDDRDGESEQHDLDTSGSNEEESNVEAPQVDEDESYDHEDESVVGRRVKRQVYYESGYNGETKCDGFPLEVNVRSRIKLDRIFPIHGKSQMKKCIKIKKTLLPPSNPDDGHIDVLIPQNPYPRHY